MDALAQAADTVILGSGCLRHPWYGSVDVSVTDDGGWTLTFRDTGMPEDPGGDYVITHNKMLHTIGMIASNADGAKVSDDTRVNCRAFVDHGWQETDFDAGMADQVVQVAAFGKVIYG